MTLQSLALACIHAPHDPYPHLAALKLALDAENHPYAQAINPYASILANAAVLELLTGSWLLPNHDPSDGYVVVPSLPYSEIVRDTRPPTANPSFSTSKTSS